MNDSHRTLPQQSVEKNIQFHARVENGIVVKREGFFFPGIGFRYSKNKQRGNSSDQKNPTEMVEVRFMRDEAQLSKVVYAFFKRMEKPKPNTVAFLKLTHPDYVPEKSPGVYYDIDELPAEQRLAVAVMVFLKIARHKETVRRFSYFESAQAKSDAQSAHQKGTAKVELGYTNTHSVEQPTFSLWQDCL